jgi:hypothetical protein
MPGVEYAKGAAGSRATDLQSPDGVHRASNMQKTVRRAQVLWATDLQTGRGVKGGDW